MEDKLSKLGGNIWRKKSVIIDEDVIFNLERLHGSMMTLHRYRENLNDLSFTSKVERLIEDYFKSLEHHHYKAYQECVKDL